jgi:F-type H+-transporting ATPase subunit delta
MASGAAKRYAQAVFELAKESERLDQWEANLARFAELMTDERAAGYFANPNVTTADKQALLDRVLADAQPEVRNLAGLLLQRQRLGIVPDLFRLYTEAVLNERGIAIADVTTAEPLGEAEQALVRAQLSRVVGKEVQLRLRTDPEIIGGIVAKVGDQLIDGSVVNQLRRLRARLQAPA